MGLQDKAFEAVVLRHRDAFSDEAVNASKERLRKWGVAVSDRLDNSYRELSPPA
jgi:hypothetical protein